MLFKTLKSIFFILTFLLFLGVAYFAWLNLGSFTRTKYQAIKTAPFPVAYAQGKLFWLNDFEKFLLETKNSGQPSVNELNSENFEKFRQYLALNALKGWDGKNYNDLKILYYKNSFQTSGIESTFNIIKEGLDNKKSFSSLNQEYDQDPYSKSFFGDLGYLEASKILPEILSALDSMTKGEVRPIPSRHGWHIIQLIDIDRLGQENGQRFHLKQIFLKVDGFEKWLSQETKKIKIFKLINF